MKKTSYQKLKQENESLRLKIQELITTDIYNLVVKTNEKEGALCAVKWGTVFAVERSLMHGCKSESNIVYSYFFKDKS